MKRKSGEQQQQQQRPTRKEKRSRRWEQHEHLAAAPDERPVTAAEDVPAIKEGGSFTQLQLPPNQSVVLSGAAVLEVTHGCVAVYGALVTPESGPVQLQAPAKLGKALLLTALPLNRTVAPPAAPSSAATHAVLQPLDSGSGGGSTYTVVDAAAPEAPAAWQVPGAWQQAAADLTAAAASAAAGGAPLVAAVCGSKGAGKSAFARLLANSLLSAGTVAVGYLDLDPGQPEFTPPGLLSLRLLRQPVFGAAHLQHTQPPLLQFFQGDTSSQSEPGRYLQAVQALISRYHSLADAAAAAGGGGGGVSALPPLVINTPGWITGLGLELLGEVLRCAQPTHVVQLATSNPKKNLPGSCWWSDGAPRAAAAAAAAPLLMQVPSVGGADTAAAGSSSAALAGPCLSGASGDTTLTGAGAAASKGRGMSAVASRGLMWLAWAQRIIAANPAAAAAPASDAAAVGAAADEFADAAAGLAAAMPFEASLAGLRVEVLHAQVVPADLAAALNGAVVGLAAAAAAPSDGDNEAVAAAASQQPRECLGLGLVRAVDARRQALYLLTDVPAEQLSRVEVLTLGKLELPDRLLEGRGAASPYQGLFCLTSTATGAGQIKSRNNLLRASRMGAGLR